MAEVVQNLYSEIILWKASVNIQTRYLMYAYVAKRNRCQDT